LDAKLRKERFFDIVSQALEAQAKESPLLLIFEDLHWADPISLELLDHVARNLGDSPLLLLGLRRPTGGKPKWDDLPHHQVIELDELSAEESQELVASLLHLSSVPSAFESLILDRAQGNPFYVEEVIHMLMDRGHLVPENEGHRFVGDLSVIEVPDTISGVVMSRIDSLDEGCRTALRVASVIGRIFAFNVLQVIYPRPIGNTALQRRLETLRRVDLTPLEEPEPNLRYIFKHILTQEVAYESLLHARRRELHSQVALYYEETRCQEGLEEYYELLAYHFGRSAYRDKALEYAIRAGDRNRATYANDAAIRHYSAALQLQKELGQEGTLAWADLHFKLGEVYVHVGRYEEAITSYQQALDAAGQNWEVEQQARTLRKIGWTHQLRGQYREALEWLIRAREVAESAPPVAKSRQMARILADTGAVHIRRAEYKTGITLIERALDLLAKLPKDLERVRDEGWAYTRLGVAHVHQGNFQEARTFFEQSLTLRAQAGDLVGIATLHNNLGYVAHHLQGDLQAAIQSYQRSLDVCHQIGYRYMMAMASNNLGLAHQALGNYRQAIVYYQHSLRIRQEMGDLYGTASSFDNLGLAYYQRGDYEKAMEYHHLSLEIKRKQEDAFQIANSLINIATVCCDQGHYDEAIAFAEEALEAFQDIGGREYLAETYAVLAQALLLSGEGELAHQHAILALETAEETGGRRDQAIAGRVLGEVEMALSVGEPPDRSLLLTAQDRLQKSVASLEEVGDRFELGKSLRSLGCCLKLRGREAEAESYLARATQIFEALGAQGELRKPIGWEVEESKI
jgi:predicted ATPase